MARESDNIHIIALTKAAAVPIRVIYMDRSQQSSLTIHDFPATDDEPKRNIHSNDYNALSSWSLRSFI